MTSNILVTCPNCEIITVRIVFYAIADHNVAVAEGGATCDSSSWTPPAFTCLNTLLDNASYWRAAGEGPGAWMKVSFPRANVGRIGIASGCDIFMKIKSLAASFSSSGNETFDFEVIHRQINLVNLRATQSHRIHQLAYRLVLI